MHKIVIFCLFPWCKGLVLTSATATDKADKGRSTSSNTSNKDVVKVKFHTASSPNSFRPANSIFDTTIYIGSTMDSSGALCDVLAVSTFKLKSKRSKYSTRVHRKLVAFTTSRLCMERTSDCSTLEPSAFYKDTIQKVARGLRLIVS
jgi:hypothetical protein